MNISHFPGKYYIFGILLVLTLVVSGCSTVLVHNKVDNTGTPIVSAAAPTTISSAALPQNLKGWQTPWPIEDLLWDVWGTSSSDVFVVGKYGVILHYDGQTWSRMKSGTQEKLVGIWGMSSNDVFAVGFGGIILHYNGEKWQKMNSGTNSALSRICGISSNDVYTTSMDGLLHYDGSKWSHFSEPPSQSIKGFWVSPEKVLFALSDNNSFFYRDDDMQWTAFPVDMIDGLQELTEIWGSSSRDIYAVGKKGEIVHFDGSKWQRVDHKIQFSDSEWLFDIWGTSPDNVYAVGDKGKILHFDGAGWSSMDGGGRYILDSIWGSSASDIFVVGGLGGKGVLLHYSE